jgi:hypothetical protein
MNATRPLVIALAVLAVTTGVAAAAGPGIADSPADAPDAQTGRVQVDATTISDTVTLTVSHRGEPLQGAAVVADSSRVGTTDANGTVTVPVADRLTVRFHDGVTDRRLVLAVDDGSVRVVHGDGSPAAEAVGASAANAVSRSAPPADAPGRSNETTDAGGLPAAATGDQRGHDAPGADAAVRRGPPADLPDAVPDRVGEIHRTIRSFLDGTLDGTLGESLRTLGGQSDARPDAADSSETAA